MAKMSCNHATKCFQNHTTEFFSRVSSTKDRRGSRRRRRRGHRRGRRHRPLRERLTSEQISTLPLLMLNYLQKTQNRILLKILEIGPSTIGMHQKKIRKTEGDNPEMAKKKNL